MCVCGHALTCLFFHNDTENERLNKSINISKSLGGNGSKHKMKRLRN